MTIDIELSRSVLTAAERASLSLPLSFADSPAYILNGYRPPEMQLAATTLVAIVGRHRACMSSDASIKRTFQPRISPLFPKLQAARSRGQPLARFLMEASSVYGINWVRVTRSHACCGSEAGGFGEIGSGKHNTDRVKDQISPSKLIYCRGSEKSRLKRWRDAPTPTTTPTTPTYRLSVARIFHSMV